MDNVLDKYIDIDHLKYNKVVLDHFLCHDSSKKRVRISYSEYRVKLMAAFALLGNWRNYAQPLDFIAHYYGERQGMYFSWLVHYTSWLFIPAILVLIVTIIQI